MENAKSFLSSLLSAGGASGRGAPAAAVSSIYVYPIKSCRGISLSQAPVSPTGFRWDRQWLVVNSKGRAYTQRVEPKLALVEIEMPNGAFDEGWEPTVDSYMVIKAPGMDPLKVPLVAEYAVADEVSVWEWSGPAHDGGVGAADWFSSYLGKPSRLVRFWTASEIRPVDVKYAQGHKVLFADGYPFLVASQGSLNALNEVLHEPININRFRPNILVDGCNPYAEDLWKEIKINNLTFNGVKLCSRCKVPTINQENGIAGTEPTETMMKYRSDHVLRPACKQKGVVYFGQNMVWQDSLLRTMNGKLVKVGDPVYVVREYASCADVPA
ncbi:molybdenum cofactor sulfurase family protein [Carex rostrata]